MTESTGGETGGGVFRRAIRDYIVLTLSGSEGGMEVLTVALFGAIIGFAFMLFDFSWGSVRFFTGWFRVHPATILAMSAVGGAVVISAEFWLAAALWEALM